MTAPGAAVAAGIARGPVDRPELVEVFADISCPFAYVGLRRFVDTRDALDSAVRIHVRAWPLEWVNGHPLDADLVGAEIAALRSAVAPNLFAGFDPARWPATTVPALGLAAAAYAVDLATGEQVSIRLREALFEEGRDIAEEAELAALGRPFGVEPVPVAVADHLVRIEWEDGRARGVLGSPHFFVRERNWFCPSLTISHVGADFDIALDPTALDEFYAIALGSPPAAD